jgi:hypothetical protein
LLLNQLVLLGLKISFNLLCPFLNPLGSQFVVAIAFLYVLNALEGRVLHLSLLLCKLFVEFRVQELKGWQFIFMLRVLVFEAVFNIESN